METPDPNKMHFPPRHPEVRQFMPADIEKETYEHILRSANKLTNAPASEELRFGDSFLKDEVFENHNEDVDDAVSTEEVIGRKLTLGSDGNSIEVGLLNPLGIGLTTGAYHEQGPGSRVGYVSFIRETEEASLSGLLWLFNTEEVLAQAEVVSTDNQEKNYELFQFASQLGLGDAWMKATQVGETGRPVDINLFLSDKMGRDLAEHLGSLIDQSGDET